jgi:hypothetical protein
MRKAFLLTGLVLGCVSPAAAQLMLPGSPPIAAAPAPGLPQRSIPPHGDRAFNQLRSEIIDLREQALALQASDGGTLTNEHRDTIQTRIDAAYRRYHFAQANGGSAYPLRIRGTRRP